jgi:hypothetical protein
MNLNLLAPEPVMVPVTEPSPPSIVSIRWIWMPGRVKICLNSSASRASDLLRSMVVLPTLLWRRRASKRESTLIALDVLPDGTSELQNANR